MSPVEFKKTPCRPVDFKGKGSQRRRDAPLHAISPFVTISQCNCKKQRGISFWVLDRYRYAK